MESMKKFIAKYKHGIPLIIYGFIYLTWFAYLEKTVTTGTGYHVIHMAADDYIPFCEIFIVPYLLWFVYIAAVVLFFFFRNKADYCRVCTFLFTGMTVFLMISTLWPNGHHLRPAVLPRDNIFSDMVSALWQTDTPTNLWPSIHVYNSLGAHIAIMKSSEFKNKRFIRLGSLVLCVSIILSTVFLKQHSLFDVLTAFVMAAVMYLAVYQCNLVQAVRNIRSGKKAKPQIEG